MGYQDLNVIVLGVLRLRPIVVSLQTRVLCIFYTKIKYKFGTKITGHPFGLICTLPLPPKHSRWCTGYARVCLISPNILWQKDTGNLYLLYCPAIFTYFKPIVAGSNHLH